LSGEKEWFWQEIMFKDFELEGKVSIVTGGGRGICRAICLVLAEAGSDGAVFARTRSEIEETASLVRRHGRIAMPIVCDVTEPKQVNNMVKEIVSELGRIDILVNHAGSGKRKPLVHLPGFKIQGADREQVQNFYVPINDEEWNYVFDVNLKRIFLCTRPVGLYMIRQNRRKILKITYIG